ncbi:hypothetical protein DQ04_01171130 [Trypanosoma grayi]|uniref:hypothetical protein n=1 Tax=Trypanosoma grayi TaxID=71804 RepID=UPI0004F49262|nr:hypothetical protein DQ04_01171130 [Trypanosoma grayi]KEG13180.1 hypothetical protein DQ04_01171130 [Trypanosoma grayi]
MSSVEEPQSIIRSSEMKALSEPRRFATLVAGAFGCICVSLSFGFNIFSDDLRKAYDLTQADMSTISTVGIVFAYFGIPYAFVYDYFGVVPVLVLGFVLITVGALLMALTFSGTITGTVTRLCVFNGIFNFGTGVYDLACVVTVLSIFPTRKGVVVAVMKTYIGLGSAIFGQLQLAYFEGKPTNYFYFLMAVGGAIGLVVLAVMRLPPYVLTDYERRRLTDEEADERISTKALYLQQDPPSMRFAIGFLIVIFLIAFLPLQSSLVAYKNLSWGYRNGFAIVTIVVLLFYSIVAMPFSWLDRDWRFWRRRIPVAMDADEPHEPTANHPSGAGAPLLEMDFVAPQYQTRFIKSLCTAKLWAIFWSLFCTLGTEFVVLTNSRYFFAALSGQDVDDSLNTLLTVLNGVGSALGRLLMSALEVWSQERKAEDRIPITLSLFIPTVSVTIMVILFLTITSRNVLPLPYVIGALGNGIIAAVTILVVNTIYAKDPGLHYNFCFFATTCSSVLLNRLLYGEWYTREANKRGVEVCLDRGCVQLPLLVMLGFNLSAFFSNAYVHWEYHKLNRRALEERRRLIEERLVEGGADDSSNSLLLEELESYTGKVQHVASTEAINDVTASPKQPNTGVSSREGITNSTDEEAGTEKKNEHLLGEMYRLNPQ